MDSVFAKKKLDSKREFLNFDKINILDNFKSLLFCYHTFDVRRSIDVLDLVNQPGSGKIRAGSGSESIKTIRRLSKLLYIFIQ